MNQPKAGLGASAEEKESKEAEKALGDALADEFKAAAEEALKDVPDAVKKGVTLAAAAAVAAAAASGASPPDFAEPLLPKAKLERTFSPPNSRIEAKFWVELAPGSEPVWEDPDRIGGGVVFGYPFPVHPGGCRGGGVWVGGEKVPRGPWRFWVGFEYLF